jgi:hypothetical protein
MKTAIELLKQDIDSEIKLGTKLVVNWDMYLEIEKKQMFGFTNEYHVIGEGTEKFFKEEFQKYYNETYGENHNQVPDTRKMVDKDEQKGILVEIMELDSKDGLYHTPPKTDIKDNKIMLLEEDLWCVHKYLDDLNIERNDGDGKEYSIVGRIKRLQNRFILQMSELETNEKCSEVTEQIAIEFAEWILESDHLIWSTSKKELFQMFLKTKQ